MRRAALAAGIALALTIGAGALYLSGRGLGPLTMGVDVSHHQGAIDWRALAATDVRFAYIKATEGASHVDPRFDADWADAAAAGLPRGAYHFFTLCRPGTAQAAHFIATVPRDAGALPPALDLEHMGPCRKGATMPDPQAEALAWMDAVEAHYGRRPIVYTTREFHDAHLRGMIGEAFWLRSLYRPPEWRADAWLIWQKDNRGRRRGVDGPVDINAFRGDEDALARFAGGEIR